MKKYIGLIAVVVGLAIVGDASAFLRNVSKVVVKQNVVKQNVVVKQQVQVQKVVQVQQVQVQRIVAQVVSPVYYQPQAIVVQPVQAFYAVQQVQAVQSYGYGSSLGLSSGCAQGSAQIQALQAQVRQLQIAEQQRLETERQRLVAPMSK